MSAPRPFIERFFRRYEEGANTFDPDLETSLFANDFLDCGPKGVIHVRNDEEFRRVIPERQEFMAGIGFQQAEITSLDETILTDSYSMVNAGWRMTLSEENKTNIAEFEILYFLYIQNNDPKVVMYISHDDEQETMEEMGLL